MLFRQFLAERRFAFIIWKKVDGRIDKGHCPTWGGGWQFSNDRNKQTFKLELIL